MISETRVQQEFERELQPPSVQPEPAEITLLDLAIPLVQDRFLIAKCAAVFAVVALVISLFIPNTYKAVTKILPPQQAQSSLSSMLGQLGALSGLAGGKDVLGLKNPSDLYVGILKSRSIADQLIEQFDLKTRFKTKSMLDARNSLESGTAIETSKDGMIAISFEDKDPAKAAEIANAYVERLYQANQRLAISEASQRRMFYQKELADEKEALALAEVELKKTQEKTGLIQLGSQADAIIRASAMLKAQITAKEVQLQGMRSFSTEQNPTLLRGEQELAALKSQMMKLENDQKLGGGNIQIPTGKVPEVGLEYARHFRDVKYHEVLFEVLAKQYEAAKIDEGKNAPLVQVIDPAIAPEKKSGPHRGIITLGAGLVGFVLACLYSWGSALMRQIKSDPEQRIKLQMMREALKGDAAVQD